MFDPPPPTHWVTVYSNKYVTRTFKIYRKEGNIRNSTYFFLIDVIPKFVRYFDTAEYFKSSSDISFQPKLSPNTGVGFLKLKITQKRVEAKSAKALNCTFGN